MKKTNSSIFKKCSNCGHEWQDLRSFIIDKDLNLNGYQVSFKAPDQGLILLTHDKPGCGTTLVIKVSLLRELYRGPEYRQVLVDTKHCQRHCLKESNLESCNEKCALAWIREVMQNFKNHKYPEVFLRKELNHNRFHRRNVLPVQ